MLFNADYYIQKLNLQPHAEGGFYTSTFTVEANVSTPAGDRPGYTSIYFCCALSTSPTFIAYNQMNFGIIMAEVH